MKFICLTLLIISEITYSGSEQYEVVGPADPVFAVAGEDVILPCSVKPNISVVDMRVEWFRSDLKEAQLVHLYEDHEDRTTDQPDFYRGRTKLNHQELQRGNASLKLSSVQVSDEGSYKCFIESKSWSDDAIVDLRVEAVGRPPVITVDGYDDSGGLHLLCESEGWNPEPDLEWLNSEGVSLSSETTETHRNTDGFRVKHTITVYEKDNMIHCRVKLKHHMLETMIISSSKRFNPRRTSVILISAVVVLIVIAGMLIAAFVNKNREFDQLKDDNGRIQEDHNRLQDENKRIKEEHDHLENEKSRKQQEYDEFLQTEKGTIKELQEKKSKIKQECDKLQNEISKIKHERVKLQKEIKKMLKVDVILDADTAHPHLIVSDDGKQVRSGQTKEVDRGKHRFNEFLGVLGKDGFFYRCLYCEVQVKGQTEWYLGVTREGVNRKGSVSLSPNDGYWTVSLKNGKYQAHESPCVSLSLSVEPQRIGVSVNYQKGFVSFYDVESMSVIYSYTDQSFDEKKLYPFVSLGYLKNEDFTPLIFCDDY